jgi:putative protease
VPKTAEICVQVRTEEQLKAAEDFGIQTKYLSYDLFQQYGTEQDVCVLPSVTKEGEKLNLEKAKRVMVQNIGQIKLAEGKILYGGERLNVTNSETVKQLEALGVKRVTLSTELNLREIKQTVSATTTPTELILYGRLPVMLMENCVIKSAYHCTKGQGKFALQDRMGEQFPLICEGCRNVLLNSVPLYMADKMADLSGLNVWTYRLLFTTETYAECQKVIKAYRTGIEKGVPHGVFEKITRGHFYRGVE